MAYTLVVCVYCFVESSILSSSSSGTGRRVAKLHKNQQVWILCQYCHSAVCNHMTTFPRGSPLALIQTSTTQHEETRHRGRCVCLLIHHAKRKTSTWACKSSQFALISLSFILPGCCLRWEPLPSHWNLAYEIIIPLPGEASHHLSAQAAKSSSKQKQPIPERLAYATPTRPELPAPFLDHALSETL